jgi:hypothetical protein
VKRWKKRHIGIDDQGQVAASTVTESNEQDPSQVPELLDQIDEEIEPFIGDGIFDQEPVYAGVEAHSPGARVIIPPRKDAVLSPTGSTAPTQRDQHLLEIERAGRFAWKRASGYDNQAHAENAFSRYKRIFGGSLRTKRDESQAREASVGCDFPACRGRIFSTRRDSRPKTPLAIVLLAYVCPSLADIIWTELAFNKVAIRAPGKQWAEGRKHVSAASCLPGGAQHLRLATTAVEDLPSDERGVVGG